MRLLIPAGVDVNQPQPLVTRSRTRRGHQILDWAYYSEDKDAESQDFAPNSPAFLERAPEVTPRIVARSSASAPRRLLITGLINNKSFPIRRYLESNITSLHGCFIFSGGELCLPSPLMAPSTIHILHAGRMHFVPYPVTRVGSYRGMQAAFFISTSLLLTVALQPLQQPESLPKAATLLFSSGPQ